MRKVQVDGLTLGYRESGTGPPVLLLHGWPTSSLLWREVMGPIGLHWLLDRPGRVIRLALLNTLVYPEFSDAVKEFIRACAAPDACETVTSPSGLEKILRDGLADRASLSPDALAALLEPFQTPDSRRALAAAGIGVERRGFIAIAQKLPSLRVPVRIIYGERDRLLPDVATTMARVKADLPQADVTAFADRGHFIQCEAPEQVGELLTGFFAS